MKISINTIAITMTKNKREIYRKDILTGEILPRHSLVRLVKKEDKILIDSSLSMGGRGAYIRIDEVGKKRLKDGKALSKVFRAFVPPSAIEALLEELSHDR